MKKLENGRKVLRNPNKNHHGNHLPQYFEASKDQTELWLLVEATCQLVTSKGLSESGLFGGSI